jgi:hypothetical protein
MNIYSSYKSGVKKKPVIGKVIVNKDSNSLLVSQDNVERAFNDLTKLWAYAYYGTHV